MAGSESGQEPGRMLSGKTGQGPGIGWVEVWALTFERYEFCTIDVVYRRIPSSAGCALDDWQNLSNYLLTVSDGHIHSLNLTSQIFRNISFVNDTIDNWSRT